LRYTKSPRGAMYQIIRPWERRSYT